MYAEATRHRAPGWLPLQRCQHGLSHECLSGLGTFCASSVDFHYLRSLIHADPSDAISGFRE